MDVLISFVNQTYTPELKLGRLDTASGSFNWILEGISDVSFGATGVIADRECLYVCAQQSDILVFDKSGLKQRFQPERISDAHSLRVREGELYCISSGSNEIFLLKRGEDGQILSEQLHWSMPGVSNDFDAVHLNSLEVVGNEIYASGFGERSKDQMWSEIESGFVINTESNQIAVEGVRHTHSITAFHQQLLFCESLEGAVKILGSTKEYKVGGYTRGLCLDGDIMYVGSSHRRALSKSTGKLLKGRTGEFEESGSCRITAVDFTSGETKKVWDLAAYGNEIYDIYPNPPAFIQAFCTTDPLKKRIQSFEKSGATLLQRAETIITNATSKFHADSKKLTESLRRKESEIDKLSTDKKRLAETLTNKESEIDKLSTNQKTLAETVTSKESEIDKLGLEIEQLLLKVSSHQKGREEAEKQNTSFESKIRDMKTEISLAQEAQERLETLYDGSIKQLEETETQLANLLELQKNLEAHVTRLVQAPLLKKRSAYKTLANAIKTTLPEN